MAKIETERLRPEILAEDTKCCDAITALGDYKPTRSKFTKTELAAACKEVTDSHKAEVEADAESTRARERVVRAEWAFHNLILGAKEQVVGQYGNDSDEVKTIGLKKKSEYKRPTRRKKVVALDKTA